MSIYTLPLSPFVPAYPSPCPQVHSLVHLHLYSRLAPRFFRTTFFCFVFRFHIYVLAYGICFSLSDLLHSVWQTLGPSTSLQITQFRFFLCDLKPVHYYALKDAMWGFISVRQISPRLVQLSHIPTPNKYFTAICLHLVFVALAELKKEWRFCPVCRAWYQQPDYVSVALLQRIDFKSLRSDLVQRLFSHMYKWKFLLHLLPKACEVILKLNIVLNKMIGNTDKIASFKKKKNRSRWN